MFNKIIAIIASAAIALTGFAYSSLNEVIDAACETIFGIPYTAESIKADFFNEIDEGDIVQIDEDAAYVKDKIAVFLERGISFWRKASFFRTCGGTLAGWSAPANLYVLRYPSDGCEEALGACEVLSERSEVALAIPVFAFKTRPNLTPNDPFDTSEKASEFPVVWDEKNPAGENWWLEAVCARQAWDYSDYFGEILVGVVDSGFDAEHPDLKGKILFPDKKQERRNRPDDHGNHVAGIIAANRNDGAGIAGICDNVKLLCVDWSPEPLQFWSTDLSIFFSLSTLVKAGARVVNYSLGVSIKNPNSISDFFVKVLSPMALSYEMSSLLANGYDFAVVQSAGNGDSSGRPTNSENNGRFASISENNIFTGARGVAPSEILDRIIITGSSGVDGGRNFHQSSFSNVGLRVDATAPGENVYSCMKDGGYGLKSGTSMAAPIATGTAALVWSTNPKFSGAQVKEIVCSSSKETVPPNDADLYDNDVDLKEYPMINAKLAVEEAIRRTYPDVGTVSGAAGENVKEIFYGGVKRSVFSDGTFSFVAREGSGTLQALSADGSVISSFDIEIKRGETVLISEDDFIDDFREIF